MGSSSNKKLKTKLIQVFIDQGYEYKPDITSEEELLSNLKSQTLRTYSQLKSEVKEFTEENWEKFFDILFASFLEEETDNNFHKLSFSNEYLTSIIKENIDQNYLQIINSFLNENDLIILINGLPIVYIKIETSSTSTRDLWSLIKIDDISTKLLKFIKIFVVSNGIQTRYCSSVDLFQHKNNFSPWTDENNSRIEDLIDFSKTFLSKQILLDLLTKYHIEESCGNFKILRPYQFWAIKTILKKIYVSIVEKEPSQTSGGYICHAIGTGKTITSCKAAQLSLKIPDVQKVIYVVHKNEIISTALDKRKSYISKDSQANIRTSTQPIELLRLLKFPSKFIIFTTISTLKKALSLISEHDSYPKRTVIIVEECHKFTTKEFHSLIHSALPKANLFGFTGTPWFWNPFSYNTSTKNVFGSELHNYSLIDSIIDGHSLPFHIEYVGSKNTFTNFNNPKRIQKIVKYIIKESYQQLSSSKKYSSIFTVESLKTAIHYYEEFQKQITTQRKSLRVEILYYPSTSMEKNLKKFYKKILKIHELENGSSIDNWLEHKEFICRRIKNGDIHILIVLNTFIDDLSISNIKTIWIDRNMQNHRLMHAISITNRVYDENKPYGKVVCFRDLSKEINKVIAKYCCISSNTVFNFEELIKGFSTAEGELMSIFSKNQATQNLESKMKFYEAFKKYMDFAETLAQDHRFEDYQKISEEQFNLYRREYEETLENSVTEEPNEEDVPDLELLSLDLVDEEYIFKVIQDLKQNNGTIPKPTDMNEVLKNKIDSN